jgi:PTH1 family peptidyl-tRNA hydrolase
VTEDTRFQTTESLHLIVGLGNPGAEYAKHRHNIGFQVLDALARAYRLSFARDKAARAWIAEGQIDEVAVLLAKPKTFMNRSGQAVGRLTRSNDIPPGRTLVVYDDLDLPLGRLRLRPQGGSGGHKGMRSIIDTLGTREFARLRIGIDRPPAHLDPADYVLQPFDEVQRSLLDKVVEVAVSAAVSWLSDGIVVAMDQYNRPFPEMEPQEDQQ